MNNTEIFYEDFIKNSKVFHLMEKVNKFADCGLYFISGSKYDMENNLIEIYLLSKYDYKIEHRYNYKLGFDFLKEELEKISKENNIIFDIKIEEDYKPWRFVK